MPAARGNERGHFENMDFVEFHMRELRLSGYDDSGWTTLHTLTLSDEATSEAHDLIETNARSSAWGWKDPRTTLFLDFWSGVVSEANYLYVYREPSEVIDSLYRRGDESIRLTPELAARAYITHNDMMLDHARRHRAQGIIANVSAVARDPKYFLAMLAEKLGVNLNVHAPSTFEGELMQTIASDDPRATLLRHHVPEIERLYARLESAADIPSTTGERKHASARVVKDAFFNDWLLANKREAESAQRDAELSKQLEAAKATLDELEASNAKRGEYLEEAERLLTAERAAREAELQRIHDERAAREAELQRIHDERAAREAEVQRVRNEVERAERAAREAEVQSMRDEVERAATRERDALAQNVDLRAAIADLEGQTERARHHIENLEQRLEHTTREFTTQTEALIAATRAESDRVAFLIATVQSSRFWKIKRGINRLLRSLGLRAQE